MSTTSVDFTALSDDQKMNAVRHMLWEWVEWIEGKAEQPDMMDTLFITRWCVVK